MNCYFCLRLGLGGNWEGPQKQFSVETERQGLKAAWTASGAAGMVSAATKMVSAAVGLFEGGSVERKVERKVATLTGFLRRQG